MKQRGINNKLTTCKNNAPTPETKSISWVKILYWVKATIILTHFLSCIPFFVFRISDTVTCRGNSLKTVCFSIDPILPGQSKCFGCESCNACCHASLTIIRRLGYGLAVPPSTMHLHEPS